MAAAAAVSVSLGVMKPILAKLTTLMGDEYSKIKGLSKEVTFLQDELSDMDALLEKMDSADELDPQAKKWRKDLIEMSYNIEDHIDDFMHCVGQKRARDKVGILRKAREYLTTAGDRRRIANQLEEIKSRVMEASERRKRYMLDQSISVTTPVVVDPRVSALYMESASLVGIDAQKDDLVNWAMDEEKQLKFMAIVGLGGLGKTTLSNEVYREVGEKFDCKAFVSVSQKPEMIVLLNSLQNQLGLGTYSHAYQLQDHINDLRGRLQDKRYFIVVDDLWDIRAWNTICCAFPQNSRRSRVVITTRIEGVARACCGNNGLIHTMMPLSEANSRKLFFNRIFGSEDDCPTELIRASYTILIKCGGLPLAIVTMASMLACQPTRLERQWEYIQNSLATKFATNSNYEDMMYILDLSYKYLPRHLKACFLYLGSYPEDYEISRVDLVRRWVAEGFVSNSDEQDVWDTAESYFNELVNRSMIQPTYKEEYPLGVFGCRVHDMLLDLIVRRCKEDNFLSLVSDAATLSKAQDKVIRRLTLVSLGGTEDEIKENFTTGQNLSQIRCFATLGKSNWIPRLLEFKFLRVLFLEISGYDVTVDLTGINQLPQLRYVSVKTYSTHTVLPRQIRGLQLLQTLDLSRIFNCSISLELVDLPCLSHLLVPRRVRLHGIAELTSLRTLRGFSLPVDSLESIVGLGKLAAMSDVGFGFPKECVQFPKATWMDALSTSLEKLGKLRKLYAYYGEVAWCADNKLSSLFPPFHNLEQLVMGGCTFPQVPRWIGNLQNLSILWLGVKQLLQEDVAMIGKGAPSLVSLRLRITGILTERIVIGGATGFQAVKYFEFNCDGISYLTFVTGAMPELRKLELVLDVDEWDKAAPSGLWHLPCLEKIIAQPACYYRAGKYCTRHGAVKDLNAERSMFVEAVHALPTGPAFSVGQLWQYRPVEEEYLNEEGWRMD